MMEVTTSLVATTNGPDSFRRDTSGAYNESKDLLLTPQINGVFDGSVNTSAISGGISGGASVGEDNGLGETFRIDFVIDLSGNPGKQWWWRLRHREQTRPCF